VISVVPGQGYIVTFDVQDQATATALDHPRRRRQEHRLGLAPARATEDEDIAHGVIEADLDHPACPSLAHEHVPGGEG
jgi:hypothetical protein